MAQFSYILYARVRVRTRRFHYDYMVLDEGHSIKNIKSSRFQRLRVVNAKHRLLLRYCTANKWRSYTLTLSEFVMAFESMSRKSSWFGERGFFRSRQRGSGETAVAAMLLCPCSSALV